MVSGAIVRFRLDLTDLVYSSDNSDVFLGYVIWGAGAFKSSYELSMTPSLEGDTWEDVPLLTECVVR